MGSWSYGTAGIVVLPDGRRIRGRGLRFGPPSANELPELGVYLTARIPEPQAWDSVWVRWSDFQLPRHTADAIDALRHAHTQAATLRVEIACRGGSGRTGTAIALLARLAGVPAPEAVAWTRARYRPGAVETPWQRRFVASIDLDR